MALSFVQTFPVAVDEIERVLIPMADGVRLCARLWVPKDAARDPVPVIVEMHPYRSRDLFRRVDDMNARYWAGHGYAVLRVDIRGSGDSEGLLTDEYTAREIDDGAAVLAWAKTQVWCSGKAGLTGLSWPGFLALRIATRYPDAADALFVSGVSDDSFLTDIHHMGGVPFTGRASWAGTMAMFNALPPDPDRFDGDWIAAWQNRLKANKPWLATWAAHQTRDDYWRDKAVSGTGRRLTIPLCVIGGLADKYKTSTLRLLASWQGPAKGILGPWEHIYPHLASFGPAIGYLQEGLRWWDHWLKGHDTGVELDPTLRIWISNPPRQGKPSGRWSSIKEWPPEALPEHRFTASSAENLILSSDPTDNARPPIPVILPARPSATTAFPSAEIFDDHPRPIDLDAMQAAGCHLLASAPLSSALDVISTPVLRLAVNSATRNGQLTAWLADLAPDGTAHLITRGAQNLGFSTGYEEHIPVAPGQTITVTLSLEAAAWRLPADHRLVLILGAQGWPILWPAPDQADLTVDLGSLKLDLPLLTQTKEGADSVSLPPPEAAVPDAVTELKWLTLENAALPPPDPETDLSHSNGFAAHHLTATQTDYIVHGRFDLGLMNGQQARATDHWIAQMHRPGWSVSVETTARLDSTPDGFHVAWSTRARYDGETVFDSTDAVSIPRHSY